MEPPLQKKKYTVWKIPIPNALRFARIARPARAIIIPPADMPKAPNKKLNVIQKVEITAI